MLFNPDYTQSMQEEYERRANTYRLERAVLAARANGSGALARLASQGLHRVASLVSVTWRWGQNATQTMCELLPTLGKP